MHRRDGADLERSPAIDSDRATPIARPRTAAQIDNYALARKNNITLRLDELNTGISTLLQTASATAQSTVFATPPKYRFSIYSMDSLWQIGLNQLMALTSNYTSGWTTASANFGVMEMYSNNNDCANAACTAGTTTPGGDVATNYDDSLGKLSQTSYVPNPGNGTNQPGDTPQEVLFIVTDGVEDEQSGAAASSRRSTTSATLCLRQFDGNQLVHDDQEPRHQDRDPLYRLSRGAGRQLVHEPYRAVSNRTSARPCRPAPRPACSMTPDRLRPRPGALGAVRRGHAVGPPDPIGPARPNSFSQIQARGLDLTGPMIGSARAQVYAASTISRS